MTLQSAHDRCERIPFWTVQSVFDPDGGGADFAYTIGLHDRGLPELHIWGRPDQGLDPGSDWLFSPDDRRRLLNEFSWLLVDGKLRPSETLRREYDAGLAIVQFEFHDDGDREELQAFGTADDATVWRVTWTLTRSSEGTARDLTLQALAQARRDFDDAREALDHRDAPAQMPAWAVPTKPSFARSQAFGPRTPIIRARAACLVGASVGDLNRLIHHAANVAAAGSLTYPLSVARATARTVGRTAELDRLEHDVEALTNWFTQSERCARTWNELVTSLWDPMVFADAEEGFRIWRQTASLLHDATLTCLAVEAVADAIAPEYLIAGRGTFVAAFAKPAGEIPAPEWAASPSVVEAVTQLLRPLDPQQLGGVARLHALAQDGRVQEWEHYADVTSYLSAWAVTGPASCPWEGALSDLPAWRSLVATLGLQSSMVVIAPLPELQEWASCLCAALTHRHRMGVEDVRVFVEPFIDVLPGLGALLEEAL